MTKYREILRLSFSNVSQRNIAESCAVSRKTVRRVQARAAALGISWPLPEDMTDAVLQGLMFPKRTKTEESSRKLPDCDYIHTELLRNGVTKKLLWTEYLNDCALNDREALMYSQFCYYIQQEE